MSNPLVRLTGSLQARIMMSVSLLLVILMGTVTLLISSNLAALAVRETRARGVAVAHSIGATSASSLLSYDYLSLEHSAHQSIREDQISYVTVFDKEGKMAAHATRQDFSDARPPELAEITLTPQQDHYESEKEILVGETRVRVLEVVHGVFLDGGDVCWGAVRVGMDLEPVYEEIAGVRKQLLLLGAAAILLALLGSRFISRRITASLGELVRGTIEVSQGNLDHRIEPDSVDEIGALATHFNYMTEQIRKQQNEIAVAKRELEVLNSTLEDKVARRTREFLSSEEKYRTLVDGSPDPILIVQEDEVRFANPAFDRTFGRIADGVSGISAANVFHPEDRDAASRFIERVLEGDPGDVGEIRAVTPDGTVKVFEMRGMKIHYLGEPAAEILLMDTTERKELQDHLIQHEKLRALGELASGVAHDFNNTLGIILARAQLLQQHNSDEGTRQGLRTIERAALDGGETVRRIQDFARARTEQNFDTVLLNPLLEEVVEITRTRWKDEAQLRNVTIDAVVDLGSPTAVRGSASELREIYTNLIFNAVDAMPAGGRILVRSSVEGDMTVVEVTDTGTGMDETVRARVFDPFFTTKGAKGLGMGMSVVFGIVERHGGQISVESKLGTGTTFTIRIPRAPEDAPCGSCEADPEAGRNARILVVDDEADIVELVTDILESQGHTVASASNGPDGIARFTRESFDLLVCDLGMREMTGWEVVRQVRELDADVGVLLLTGWGAALDEAKVAAHEIDAVMAKPFEMKGLLTTVAEVVGHRDARAKGVTAPR
jgi:PAS domain S-box-containing protein